MRVNRSNSWAEALQRRAWLQAATAAAWTRVGAKSVAVVGLSACTVASLVGPVTYRVPLADLQQTVASRFPLGRRLLPGVELTVSNPRLQALAAERRLAAELDYGLTGLAALPSGSLALNFGLRFDAAEWAVRLSEVQIARLGVQGVPGYMLNPLRPTLDGLLKQALEGLAIYRVKPEDQARLTRHGYRLDTLLVEAEVLAVRLMPA